MLSTFLVAFTGSFFAMVIAMHYVLRRIVPKLIDRSDFQPVEPIVDAPTNSIRLPITDSFDHEEVTNVVHVTRLRATPSEMDPTDAVRVIYTCEDHGRCVGCPKVLAQFEAILRHQGADSLDSIERGCYSRLREQLLNEYDRELQDADLVIRALIEEGCDPSVAYTVVWNCAQEDRKSFDTWLVTARTSCIRLTVSDPDSISTGNSL